MALLDREGFWGWVEGRGPMARLGRPCIANDCPLANYVWEKHGREVFIGSPDPDSYPLGLYADMEDPASLLEPLEIWSDNVRLAADRLEGKRQFVTGRALLRGYAETPDLLREVPA